MTQMNLSMKHRLTDIENRLVVAKAEGMDWEFWISSCKLLYIEWINKLLQYTNRELYSISCDKP